MGESTYIKLTYIEGEKKEWKIKLNNHKTEYN